MDQSDRRYARRTVLKAECSHQLFGDLADAIFQIVQLRLGLTQPLAEAGNALLKMYKFAPEFIKERQCFAAALFQLVAAKAHLQAREQRAQR